MPSSTGRPRANADDHQKTIWNEDGTITVKVTRLRLLADQQPLPDYQIAALARMTPIMFSHYVRGEKELTAKHLAALCSLFQADPQDLMGWTERRYDRDGKMIEEVNTPWSAPPKWRS